MKINFDKNGDDFIEVKPSAGGKVVIIISARDTKNPLSTIVNSAEITKEQFDSLVKSLDSSSLPNKSLI